MSAPKTNCQLGQLLQFFRDFLMVFLFHRQRNYMSKNVEKMTVVKKNMNQKLHSLQKKKKGYYDYDFFSFFLKKYFPYNYNIIWISRIFKCKLL